MEKGIKRRRYNFTASLWNAVPFNRKGFRQKLEAQIDEVLNAEDGAAEESKSKGSNENL